jgi:hypothetical protein
VTFPTPDENDLAELRAEVDDVGRGLDEVTERLERLEEGGKQPGQEAATGNGAPPLVAFIHIPKTAGGTVSGMFANAFSPNAVHDGGNFMRNPERTAGKLGKRRGGWEGWRRRRGARVVIGHTPYALFRTYLPTEARYITFLRDPVDRVLSHYYRHIHRDPDEDVWTPDPASPSASSLEQAMVELRLASLNNLATRFLCDDPETDELGDEALAQAKANLRRFDFVGIQERFEESVALLQVTLGLGVAPYGESRHVSSERPAVDEISGEQRSLIEEHNRLDAELYEYGRGLFETALATTGAEFASHLEQLRAASAAALEEDAARASAAREWLERELPPGATKPRLALVAAARQAGIRGLHIKRAIKELPGVEKWGAETGEVKLTRIGEPGSETAVRFEQLQAAREEVLLQEAREWIERELPLGDPTTRDSLVVAAGEAGIHVSYLRLAVEALPGVEQSVGDSGEVKLTRTDAYPEPSDSEPGPES